MSKLVIPAGMDGESLSLADRLRHILREEGRLPAGMLPAGIEASWRRSLAHGVDCLGEPSFLSRPLEDPQTLLARYRTWWEAARQELSLLVARHGREGVVILADAQAKVLSVQGCTDRMNAMGIGELVPGACSSEERCGTNALGTVVVDRAPVLIDVGEHYLASMNAISCAAVPIHDEHGQLSAVLDITQAGGLRQPGAMLAELSNAASRIEARWLIHRFPEDMVLAFHSHRPFLSSHWRGMLVVGKHGQVKAASASALDLLALRREQLPALEAGALFGLGWTALLDRLRQGAVVECATSVPGWFLQALHAPARRRAAPAPTGDRKAQVPSGGVRLPASVTGASPMLAQALHRALRGLDRDVPVLLLGETGTGKEVTARALHDASARREKPFVAINCAAIPEGLIESELFGYAPGTFTGARRGGAVGRLMQAHGGTLFLDEIGDMPLALQTRLLRVLQERRVEPLGGGQAQALDVALMCATHRDLKAMVGEGRFREDLFYRIDGFSVRLPPLRERCDLEALVAALLDRLGATTVRVHPELMRQFGLHPWPGNVRQLEMVLRTALAVREDDEDVLGCQHLGAIFRDELHQAALSASSRSVRAAPDGLRFAELPGQTSCPSASAPGAPDTLCLRDHEQALISAALQRHHGNLSAAAQALGIGRATLYRKLQRQRG
ncbi:MAG: sigma-54-dependent Fis family transcriptional regulator [Lautropia sp.]|nr:sigma-54-dependent Fis family transcriptional regulator [Lautropia sp.]